MSEGYQEYLSWTYFGDDAYDKEEFTRLDKILSGVDRFIDVGASHGVYTYYANKYLRNSDIIAIEPDPDRFVILQKNVEKWAIGSSNRIRCINAACSDEADRTKSKTITFYRTGTQISGGLFSVAERSDDYNAIDIELVCVDDFFDQQARTFIKIDVEGAELRVLQGAKRHIEAGNTKFFTEVSWWGDRGRKITALAILKFVVSSRLRIDRRLKSDYLLSPERNVVRTVWSVIKSIPPLLVRATYVTLVPLSVRTWRERRENRRRLSRANMPLPRSQSRPG